MQSLVGFSTRGSLRTASRRSRLPSSSTTLVVGNESTTLFSNGNKWRWMATATEEKPLFDKILIANRGEIACRVMRTAQDMGIKTVAIYSEADANAKHVRMADEAYCVGPAASAQSYLQMEKVLSVIKESGSQAVHPGYGFLSENGQFADMIESAGVAWVGPGSGAIHAMGDKIESKKIARDAGVNIIPGRLTEVDTTEQVIEIAQEIGYPVMIKASAGGGGKGMRIAWNDSEVEEGFRLAKQEAKASFGDDRILIEKFIDNPRHIEIQLVGDSHGNYVYLNERECSIQRRNQKVLEEAPSSFIDPETRKAMGEQAIMLAKAVNYRSAGTVEFLVDSKKNFYFLEMNTRLQVEHPVSEKITGVDLVELMLRVAAGQELPITQDDIGIYGWAMEARVYAEDPFRNFLPSIGLVKRYNEPTLEDVAMIDGQSEDLLDVRCDSAIEEGLEISMHYDPMICKLITHGSDREESIELLGRALDSYVIRGVNHNIPFLRDCIEHPRYKRGDISTKFIPEEYPEGFKGHQLSPVETLELLSVTLLMHYKREVRDYSIDSQSNTFGINNEFAITLNGRTAFGEVDTLQDEEGADIYLIRFQESPRAMFIRTDWQPESLVFNAVLADVENKENITPQDLEEEDVYSKIFQYHGVKDLGYTVQFMGTQYDMEVLSPAETEVVDFMPEKVTIDSERMVLSPMPGKIISVNVKPGDKVFVGQEVCVMEAMKMQNVLHSETDGIVKSVSVNVGDNVPVDEILIEFEKAE